MDETCGKINISLNNHNDTLLRGIWNLYKSEIGTDLMFVCSGGKTLKVHRWLMQIFAPHILEHSHTNSIELSIEKDSLELTFEFLYKGQLDVIESGIIKVKEAAELLRLDSVLKAIGRANEAKLTPNSGIFETESDCEVDWTVDTNYKLVTNVEEVINDNQIPVILRISEPVDLQPQLEQETELEAVHSEAINEQIVVRTDIPQENFLRRILVISEDTGTATMHRSILKTPAQSVVIAAETWKKNASGGVTVRCTKCEFLATEKGVYQQHVVADHPELCQEERLSCRCPSCEFVVPQKDLMYYHWRDTHKPQKQKTFECDKCDFVAQTKRMFDRHQRNKHSTDRPFSCHLCDYRGTNKLNLKVHMDVHSAKLYKCETCGKTMNSQSNMRKHLKIHLDQNFPCPVCAYPFRQKNTLRKHVLVKHNIQLPPDTIERRVRRQTEHYKTLQKIQCAVCDYTVAQKTDLLNHLAVNHQVDEHLNHIEPTIQCSECELLFYIEAELLCHMQDAHGKAVDKKVACNICWNLFSSKYLKLHRETVHIPDITKHMCHLCGFTTNSRSGLNQHMKRCSENT